MAASDRPADIHIVFAGRAYTSPVITELHQTRKYSTIIYTVRRLLKMVFRVIKACASDIIQDIMHAWLFHLR